MSLEHLQCATPCFGCAPLALHERHLHPFFRWGVWAWSVQQVAHTVHLDSVSKTMTGTDFTLYSSICQGLSFSFSSQKEKFGPNVSLMIPAIRLRVSTFLNFRLCAPPIVSLWGSEPMSQIHCHEW